MKKHFKKVLGVFVLILVVLLSPKNVIAEEMSTEYKKILNEEGTLVITDTSLEDKMVLIQNYLSKYTLNDNYFTATQCNENYSECTIMYSATDESYDIPVKYEEKISDNFKSILTNGKIVITSTSLSDNSSLIFNYLEKMNTDKLKYSYAPCNENYTACTISMSDENYSQLESHIVQIEYNEKFSEEFNKLLTNGTFKFKSLKPTGMIEDNYFLHNYVYSLSTNDYEVGTSGCDENYTKCEIYITNENKRESHLVNVSFEKENTLVKSKLNTYIKKLNELKTDDGTGWKNYKFDLIDLEMINYYATTKSKEFNFEKLNEMFPYSQTIKDIFDGSNYKYDYECGMGSDAPFYSYAEGGLSILYNDIYYGVVENIGTSAKNILYIPSNTEKTPEAFIKAAEKKIKDYMPSLNVKITKNQTFKDYVYANGWMNFKDVTDAVKDLVDINKTVDNVFTIDFGNFKVDFLIVADSSKTVKPEFLTYDVETNISITSSTSTIPLDTSIEVEKLDSGKVYNKIIKILDVKENEMYDIKLYSNAKNEYITKLENGKFEVKMPVPENLEGKNLVIYYVDENNKITEHEVTVKDNYAIFETDHFSIYTLAEKKIKNNEKIPETIDNIETSILISFVSLIGIVSTTLYLKKETN